jgi:hypothetical protein
LEVNIQMVLLNLDINRITPIVFSLTAAGSIVEAVFMKTNQTRLLLRLRCLVDRDFDFNTEPREITRKFFCAHFRNFSVQKLADPRLGLI